MGDAAEVQVKGAAMTTVTAGTNNLGHASVKVASKRGASKKREALPNSTIVVLRRAALGIALVLWTVAAFSGEQYQNKQLHALKCHPFSSQAYSKSSLHTFGTCRKL